MTCAQATIGPLDGKPEQLVTALGVAVTIQRRSTTGGTFRTIDTARTTTSGAFWSSTRVTQSAAYRARVPQTSTCLGTASTAERVIALRNRRSRR